MQEMLETLCLIGARPALVAAVALGYVESLDCAYQGCEHPGGAATYSPPGPGRNPWKLTTDRIVPGREGGTYSPDNVRPMHHRCNTLSYSRNMSDETRRRMSASHRGLKHSPATITALQESWRRRRIAEYAPRLAAWEAAQDSGRTP